MAIHLLPFLIAKVAGKIAAKKAVAHHGAHNTVARKVVKEGTQRTFRRAMQPKNKDDSSSSS
jgi:hypothetical protein